MRGGMGWWMVDCFFSPALPALPPEDEDMMARSAANLLLCSVFPFKCVSNLEMDMEQHRG